MTARIIARQGETMPDVDREIICGGFEQLERAFCAQVKRLHARDPLAPMVVLVPNRLLSRHLARALLECNGPHANIQFMLSGELAWKLAEEADPEGFAPEPPAFVTRLHLDRVAGEKLESLPYFRPLARRDGFHDAVLATIRDFEEAGLQRGDLLCVLDRLQSKGYLPRKLRELGILWEALDAFRARNRFRSEAEAMRVAAEAAPRCPWLAGLQAFLIYGFYDLNGAQQRMIGACADVARATAFFPFQDTPAYEYALPTLNWFRRSGFASRNADPAPAHKPPILARLSEALFSESTGAPDILEDRGDALELLSAPGETREAMELVREVVHPPESMGENPSRRFGILLRSAEEYPDLLRGVFMDVNEGDVGYLAKGGPLSRTPFGKAMLLLAELTGSAFPRVTVMDFLSLAIACGDADEAAVRRVARWNEVSMGAGIVEGTEWFERLGRFAADEAHASLRAEAEELAAVASDLFHCIQKIAAAPTWADWVAGLLEVADAYIPVSSDAARQSDRRAVHDVIGELAAVDCAGVSPTPDVLRKLLSECLEARRPPVGAFGRSEPAVLDLMSARGVPFDVVLVPGMVEKAFPASPRQDALLPDSERAVVNRVLVDLGMDAALPDKSRRRMEERLLFTLAVQSARKRLVLSWPRMDAQSARPRIPSHFLLTCMEALTGRVCDFDQLERAVRNGSAGRSVRLTRFDHSLRERCVSRIEYDLVALGKAVNDGAPEAMAYLVGEGGAFFSQAVKAESARYETPRFTEYDGVVESPEALALFAGRFPGGEHPVSATELEAYATCPMSYLFRRLLRAEPLEEPDHVATISPLHRGSLVHGVLWEFLSTVVKENALPLRAEHHDLLARIAGERLGRFERYAPTGYPLAWAIEKRNMLADLHAFLDHEIAERSGFAPRYFEVRFGMPAHDSEESDASSETPVAFDLDGETIRFCGKIDRVDADDGRRLVQVIDYKTGRAGHREHDSLEGGSALQLPVYLLAAKTLFPEFAPDEAAYFYATSRGEFKRTRFHWQAWPSLEKSFKTTVKTILHGIRSGWFYSPPEDTPCRFCDFRPACGLGRGAEFKWEADPGRVAAFRTMREGL